MKQTIILAILVASTFSCKKEVDNSSTDFLQIPSRFRTSSLPLHSQYLPHDRLPTNHTSGFAPWTLVSPGLFLKPAKLERGQLAEITGAHATSSNWSSII